MNRRKQYFKVLIAFCSLLTLLFFNTCQKIELTREALVQTNSYSMGNGIVSFTGTIVDLGDGVSDHGFIVSTNPNPSTSNGIQLGLGSASQTGQFYIDLSDAPSGSNFYFRAYAIAGGETIYGESINFSTPGLAVSTQTATVQSKSSAIINGIITNLGFESVTDHGFYWANDPTPQNFSENKISLGSATETTTFSSTLTGLTLYEEYFFIAYAENGSETKFGTVGSFKMENIWTQIQNVEGGGRYGVLAFSLGESGYITGGYDGESSNNNVYQFTPDPENWTLFSTGDSPEYGTAFTIGNKGYILNGSTLYEVDPVLGLWAIKTPYPGIGRYGFFAFGVGNRGYIGSGAYWDGSQAIYSNDFWEFDPQDDITNGTDINGNPMGSWVQKVDFQGASRQYGEGFSIANFGYVCSGYIDGNDDLNDFWQYDPYSTDNSTDANGNPMGAWSQKTNYPGTPGAEIVSFVIDNKAYLFTYELWLYNPLTENWVQMADFPGQSRYATAGFAINNKGYIGTGVYNDGSYEIYLDDFWEYLPPQ